MRQQQQQQQQKMMAHVTQQEQARVLPLPLLPSLFILPSRMPPSDAPNDSRVTVLRPRNLL